MKIHRAITIAFLALISACAAQYKEPSGGQPYATLKIRTNHSGATNSNVYLICTDDACEQNKGGLQIAVFNWANPNEKIARLVPGEPIRIRAIAANSTAGVGPGGGNGTIQIIGAECINTISFTPGAGHSYDIHQQLSADACRIDLIDSVSGNPPESLGPISTNQRIYK